MNLRTTLTTVALTVFCIAASAQTVAPAASAATPRVDARQAHQEKRIEQGQASGQLTPRETRRLQREQKGIARAEANAKADGTVTPQERKRLHKMQDAAGQDIRHQKHDMQKMPGAAASASGK
jgi:uncharacterized membrane protein YebE (DUF533 family)